MFSSLKALTETNAVKNKKIFIMNETQNDVSQNQQFQSHILFTCEDLLWYEIGTYLLRDAVKPESVPTVESKAGKFKKETKY